MQKHWGIFLGIKYEPVLDPTSLKYVSGAPGWATLSHTSLEKEEVRCMTIVQYTARCLVVNNLKPVEYVRAKIKRL